MKRSATNKTSQNLKNTVVNENDKGTYEFDEL